MTVSFVRRVAATLPVADIRRDVIRVSSTLRRGRRAFGLRYLTVVVVSSGESRRLKRRYLKRNQAANVLAFRYDGAGEIVLAPAVIRREARQAREPYRRALRRMIVHGLLHLAGWHHEASAAEDRAFAQAEGLLLKRLGIG